MKLLILTQKVDINDPILGFFHRWIEKFAENCESVTVICLQKGKYNFPDKVKILSLGKENGESKIKYILNFYKYIWQERKNYNSVFIHMNPEYAILGGLFWKIWGKKTALWYTHKSVNLKLRIAEKLVDKIFTASKESFRLASKKVEITGHGIDIEKFRKVTHPDDKIRIVTAGRITKSKNVDLFLEIGKILNDKKIPFEIHIAGGPVTEKDKAYFEEIKKKKTQMGLDGFIFFDGIINYGEIENFYSKGNIFANFSDTGSLDKAILEAMASGLKILTSNEAFQNILTEENLTSKNLTKIIEKITSLSSKDHDTKHVYYVKNKHSLDNLIKNITASIAFEK